MKVNQIFIWTGLSSAASSCVVWTAISPNRANNKGLSLHGTHSLNSEWFMLTLTESTSAFSEDDFQLLGIHLFSLKHVERFSCKRHYEHFDDG